MTLPDWMLLIAALLGVAVPLGLLARRLHLPPSALLAVAGVVAGALGAPYGLHSPLRAAAFEEVVAFLFLPALVFEAALGLSVRAFVRNLAPILLLAIPALLLGATLVGYSLHWALNLPLAVALVFGVLISATDPVAVVTVFRQLGVPERLLTLVEGESLLNDGVAIVVFQVLLGVALGGVVSPGGALLDFLQVFFGGLLVGTVLGLVAALLLPWLDDLSAAALTLALAYGGFVGTEQLGGLSGVTATLAAGLVLRIFLPSRAGPEAREGLHWLWANLGFVANALLFLLIGLAVDARLLLEYWPAVLLALVVVLAARALAVLVLVGSVERVAGLPRTGRRNQAVLIWGGLRGGVALALALSLPAALPARDLLVALTGGVVLGTLVINATTIARLVRRLGLDRPTRAQRFLAATARLSGIQAARARLAELGLAEGEVEAELARIDAASRRELQQLHLDPEEEVRVIARRALFVERDTYQRLSDAGLLPPPVARTLLHEVDDHLEQACLSGQGLSARRRHRPPIDRLVEAALTRMPPPSGVAPSELAYTEASARRLAARRTADALGLLESFPRVRAASLEQVRQVVRHWEQEAEQELAAFDADALHDRQAIYRRQAEGLSRMAARDELQRLSDLGLLPPHLAEQAAEAVVDDVTRR